MNKTKFAALYRQLLLETHEWAQDQSRLDKFMLSFDQTLHGKRALMLDGPTLKLAWKQAGFKGKVTYKALHALPD